MTRSTILGCLLLGLGVLITITIAVDPPDWTVCQWKGQTHRTGEEWDDGCNTKCKCIKATMNHTECFNTCPRIRHHPNVCNIVNYTSPGSCYKPGMCDCPQVECPWDCKCQYKGEYWDTASTWFDGCSYKCQCIHERRNLISCTNRCTKIIIVPPGCKLVKPKGACCEELCCEGATCPDPGTTISPVSMKPKWLPEIVCVDVVDNCKSYGPSICHSSNRQWARYNCAQYCGMCVTTKGTANGAICQFPYKYKNETLDFCSKDGHDKLWCSTTADYDKDKKWGNCHLNLYKHRCRNKINNCPAYTKSACVGDFVQWGIKNCLDMCGHCALPATTAPPTVVITTAMPSTTAATMPITGSTLPPQTMAPQTMSTMQVVADTTMQTTNTPVPLTTVTPITTTGVVMCSGEDGTRYNVSAMWYEDECNSRCVCSTMGLKNCVQGFMCPEDTAPPLIGGCQWVTKAGDCCTVIQCPTISKTTLGPIFPTNGTTKLPTIPMKMNTTAAPVVVQTTGAAPVMSTLAPPQGNVTTPPTISNETMTTASIAIGTITDAPVTTAMPMSMTMDGTSYNTTNPMVVMTTADSAPTTMPPRPCVNSENGALTYPVGDVWFEFDCKFRCACLPEGRPLCTDSYECPEPGNPPNLNCVLVPKGGPGADVKVCCPTFLCPATEPPV